MPCQEIVKCCCATLHAARNEKIRFHLASFIPASFIPVDIGVFCLPMLTTCGLAVRNVHGLPALLATPQVQRTNF
jgi:hypothetical protein